MTALERKALFKPAVTLRETTMAESAAQLGVSYNHLMLVLRGERVGSAQLKHGIAEFVGRMVHEMFDESPRGMAEHVSTRDETRASDNTETI